MSSLKKVYVAASAFDAHMLTGLLEQEGIQAVVRGDDVFPLQGGNLFKMETRPSVWVFDDERLPRAYELSNDFGRRPVPLDGPPVLWICQCGETTEEQFTQCWNCGRDKDGF